MRAFCALAALLIAALATPAIASAQAPATEEYDLGQLPSADGDGGSKDEEEEAAIAPATSTPPTAPAPETVAPVTPEAIDENTGQPRDKEKSSGGDGGAFESPAPDRPKQHLTTSGSGDGGFPALLLLLGAIAGISVGFAFWRLRKMAAAAAPGGSAPADVTSGTQ